MTYNVFSGTLNPTHSLTVLSFQLAAIDMSLCETVFSKRGFRVRSFGTGTHVKLPGAAPDRPNVYDFSATYDEIYNDLWKKDRQTYPFVS